MNNWKLRKAFTGNNTSDVQTVNGYIAAGEDNDFSVEVVPVGKEYPAPLVVPRTNLLLQSNQFDTTWATGTASVTSGESGYDGTNDAWLLSKSAASGRLYENISVNGVVTYSVYAKAGTFDFVMLRFKTTSTLYYGTYFDLANGLVGTETAEIIDSTITSVGNDWYRCSITFNQSITTVYIYPADVDGGIGNASPGNIYIQDAQLETGDTLTEYIPTTTEAVTRSWDSFSRVQNQVPGITNGTHTHTGAASDSGIAATTITGSGSGATFAYDFDTLGVLTTLTADGAGSGYKVGDKLSIDTTEGHTIEFRLVEGSNAATVSVSMGAAKPNKPIPFPVSKMRVEGLTDRTVLFMDERSRYVFPKPTPYLLDTYEGAAAAYSLRRLRSAYTGPAVRVRRASNNDELDIYFNRDGSLDTATLEAFCAGTDGFVKVWFDQGQGGNDATQTTTASQPKIVSSGSVVMVNSEPALDFDGNDFFLDGSAITNENATFICVAIKRVDGVYGLVSAQSTYNQGYELTEVSGSLSFRILNSDLDVAVSTYTQFLAFAHYDGSTQGLAINGNYSSQSSSQSLSLSTNVGIGTRIAGSGQTWNGTMQEVILYNSDQSANREGIEDNINEHYGIYEFSGLLDDYSGATAAYSLRRLSSTYTGPAIRVVKHDVGYPEMDIPFEDDGTLSVVLLEAFADGYDATVKVWYDQSGGSNDAEQSTLASQPKIVSSGSVITENGKPAIQGDGTNGKHLTTSNTTLSGDLAFVAVCAFNTSGLDAMTFGGTSPTTKSYLWRHYANTLSWRNDSETGFNSYTVSLLAANNLIFGNRAGTDVSMSVNGSNNTLTENATQGLDFTINRIGGGFSDGYSLDGTYQEMIFYNSDQSANRTGIESNINDFYSIYP
jgi:hypothetical protein